MEKTSEGYKISEVFSFSIKENLVRIRKLITLTTIRVTFSLYYFIFPIFNPCYKSF